MSARVKPSPCTSCGRVNDAATFVGKEDEKPSPGDFCVCLNCSHVMAYDQRLRLRELTDAEVIQLAGDPKLIFATNVAAGYRKWKAEK
jgi:hypothetical protein